MSFRHLATFFAVLSLFGLFACAHAPVAEVRTVEVHYPVPAPRCDNQLPISSAETQLLVPHIRQSQPPIPDGENSLCWAAGISMVSTYLGKPMAPCQLASSRMGTGMSCCHFSRPSNADYIKGCNRAADTEEISKALIATDLHFLHISRPLSEREIKHEISNGRPVLLSRDSGTPFTGTDGKTITRHVVVISGYHHDKYHVLDPAQDGSMADLTYRELVNGKNGKLPWRESWFYLSFRTDGCNPKFNKDCECGLY